MTPFKALDACAGASESAHGSRSRTAHREAGFTPIEMLLATMLVFLVVMTLATMIAPRGLDRIDQAKRMKAQLDLRALAEALEHYVIDTGDYPTTEEGLQALYVCPSMTVGWRGPYLQGRLKRDPWGRDYVYLYPGRYADLGSAFDLVSYGRDGREGGESHDADVSNFEVYLASVEP